MANRFTRWNRKILHKIERTYTLDTLSSVSTFSQAFSSGWEFNIFLLEFALQFGQEASRDTPFGVTRLRIEPELDFTKTTNLKQI
jgi:hypothetical protein